MLIKRNTRPVVYAAFLLSTVPIHLRIRIMQVFSVAAVPDQSLIPGARPLLSSRSVTEYRTALFVCLKSLFTKCPILSLPGGGGFSFLPFFTIFWFLLRKELIKSIKIINSLPLDCRLTFFAAADKIVSNIRERYALFHIRKNSAFQTLMPAASPRGAVKNLLGGYHVERLGSFNHSGTDGRSHRLFAGNRQKGRR